jgi:hypothetical protein
LKKISQEFEEFDISEKKIIYYLSRIKELNYQDGNPKKNRKSLFKAN